MEIDQKVAGSRIFCFASTTANAIVPGMKTFTVLSLAVLSLFLSGINRVSAADDIKSGKEGNARVLKVKGAVTISISGKPAEPLKEGIFVQQDQLIKPAAKNNMNTCLELLVFYKQGQVQRKWGC